MGWGGVVTFFADRIGIMLQILLLSPRYRVCVCVCKYPFIQLCPLYSLYREVLRNVFFANIFTKKCTNSHANGPSGAQVRFYGAYGVCGDCVASAMNSGIHVSITNVVLNAFRSSKIKPKYMTYFARNKGCAHTGLMCQWRFCNCGAISLLYFLLERFTS